MILPKFDFHEPTSVSDACELMAHYRGKVRPLAGGTDLLVNMKKRISSPEHLVALGRMAELSPLERSNGTIWIGAGVMVSAIAASATVGRDVPALGQGARSLGTSPAYGCSAQVVEVDVDLETGKIVIEKMTDAHDCGRAINRTSVEAQMEGSLATGMGEALFEEVKFDDRGRVISCDLAEYKLVTALDMPPVESIIVESDEPNGPFGAKEVGEGAIMPTIPAILNAVYDATGRRIHELPLTSERVHAAFKAQKVKK